MSSGRDQAVRFATGECRVGVTEHRPGRRPPRLDFPEDKLLHVYYNKYPEVGGAGDRHARAELGS